MLEALLERKTAELLLWLEELWSTGGVVWRRLIRGLEGAGHHLQARVYETRHLRNQRLQAPTDTTREASWLGCKPRTAESGRRAKESTWLLLLRDQEAALL